MHNAAIGQDVRVSVDPSSANAHWYAIQSKPLQEERAAMNVQAHGFETLLPRTRRIVRTRSSAAPSRIEPLFPRYLFVRCDAETAACKIRYTRGITKVLGTDGGPSVVDDAVVAAIQSRIGPDGLIRLTPTFARGDRLRITAGPLTDFVGVFDGSTRPADRVSLLLCAVAGSIRVVLEIDVVEKLA